VLCDKGRIVFDAALSAILTFGFPGLTVQDHRGTPIVPNKSKKSKEDFGCAGAAERLFE
jgi:hypothetical protein